MMGGVGAHEYMAPCAGGRERRRARARATRPTSRSPRADAAARRAARRRSPRPRRSHTPGADDGRGRSPARSASPAGALLKAFPVVTEARGHADGRRPRRPPRQRDQARQRARRGRSGPRAPEEIAEQIGPPGFIGPGRRATCRSCSTTARRAPAAATSPAPTATDATCAASSPAATSRSSASTSARVEAGDTVDGQPHPNRARDRGRQHLQARHPLLRAARRHGPRRATARRADLVMGSYGIGPARIMAAAVEQYADEHGHLLAALAGAVGRRARRPRQARTREERALADRLYERAARPPGLTVLYDDRDARPGREVRRRRAASAARCG